MMLGVGARFGLQTCRIIEAQNHLSWKGPLRIIQSSFPAIRDASWAVTWFSSLSLSHCCHLMPQAALDSLHHTPVLERDLQFYLLEPSKVIVFSAGTCTYTVRNHQRNIRCPPHIHQIGNRKGSRTRIQRKHLSFCSVSFKLIFNAI